MKQFITESKRYFFKTKDGDGKLRLYSTARQYIPTMVVNPLDTNSIKTATSYACVVTRPVKLNNIAGSMELFQYPPEFKDVISKLAEGIINKEMIEGIKKFPKLMTYLEFKNFEVFYKFMSTDMQMSDMVFKGFFDRIPEMNDAASIGVTKFHNATVFYPETASKRTKNSMALLLETLYDKFKEFQIIPLFGGNIRFVTISGKAIGKYNINEQSMYIQSAAKPSDSVLYTLFHEYGHKLFYLWMDNELRERVQSKFRSLRREGVTYYPSMDDVSKVEDARESLIEKFERGMKIAYLGRKQQMIKKLSPFVLVSIKEKNGDFIFQFVSEKDNSKMLDLSSKQLMSKFWKLPFDLPEKNINLGHISHATDEWFPTKYSTTNHSEWFAELFAYMMAGKLKGQVYNWVSELVYDAKQEPASEMVGSNDGESNDATQHMNLSMNPKQIVPSGNAASDTHGSNGWEVMDPYHGNQRTGSMNPVE